jgi:hypothetical protein
VRRIIHGFNPRRRAKLYKTSTGLGCTAARGRLRQTATEPAPPGRSVGICWEVNQGAGSALSGGPDPAKIRAILATPFRGLMLGSLNALAPGHTARCHLRRCRTSLRMNGEEESRKRGTERRPHTPHRHIEHIATPRAQHNTEHSPPRLPRANSVRHPCGRECFSRFGTDAIFIATHPIELQNMSSGLGRVPRQHWRSRIDTGFRSR